MDRNRLYLATALALSFSLGAVAPTAHAASPAPDASVSAAVGQARNGAQTWIVIFDDEPVASFRGDIDGSIAARAGGAGKALAATSPAVTGAAKLDVDTPDSRAYRAYLGARRADHLAAAEARLGRALAPSHVYDVALNGVAVQLTGEEAAELARQPGVRQVTPDWVDRIHTDAGPAWLKAPQVWNGISGQQSRGEGVVVGVIDTGINATHLSFAANSGGTIIGNPRGQFLGTLCNGGGGACNSKLIGIYDFTVGEGDNEPNTGADEDDHGSHVASTAVGNPLQVELSGTVRQVSGVAPRANLISYKACEGVSNCRGAWLVGALDQAVANGVDVINYSIGGSARNPWASADAIAMRNAREAGIVVVVAAGNDGPGESSITSPGNAPWVITAAAATHTRLQGSTLTLAGGDTPPPNGGVLFGASATAGSATLQFDSDPNHPLCGVGAGLGLDGNNQPDGTTNPWVNEPGRFAGGKIVTCLRGTHARVAKSDNVRRASGSATVLINQAFDGANIVSDPHSIPTTHIGFADGVKLLDWLSTGTGHTGRLSASAIIDSPAQADVLASFSGRGPNPGGAVDISGVLKPDITAPGVSILAALSTGNEMGLISGTSMATPHIAGSAALIIGAARNAGRSPAWRAEQIISALTGTARPSVRKPDGITPADGFDQGAGVADIALAVRAGLYFPSSAAGFPTFSSSNPATGGQPRNLNLHSLAHESCFQACSLSRRVVDMRGGGSWQVLLELPDGLSVSTNVTQFTLAANAGQTLNFNFQVTDAAVAGRWQFGSIRLRNQGNSGVPDTVIPVSIFVDPGNVPERIDLSVASETGSRDVSLSGLLALPSARFNATALAAPVVNRMTLPEDPTDDNPYDGGAGVSFVMLDVPANATSARKSWRLLVDASSPTATDIDLFVGEDSDANNVPGESEELCRSVSPVAVESCEVQIVQEVGQGQRRFWVLVQNWDDGPTGLDEVEFEFALVDMQARNDGLVFTGPGRTMQGETFAVRAAWDDATLLPGESRVGFLLLGARADATIAQIPVRIERTGGSPAARALAHGQPQTVRLPAGASHERIFFDVPGNASQVTFRMTNAGDYDLFVAKAGALDNSNASIGAAPARSSALRQVTGITATKTVTLSGADLSPGRWYVTPVARSGGATAQISATIDSQTALQRRFTHYFNPDRSGHGLLFDDAGNGSTWLAVWYTYLADGSATWYLMAGAAPAANAGQWTVPLLRVAWDGTVGSVTEVGQATLSFTGENPGGLSTLVFSYQLDGETGSERMQELTASRNCPTSGGSLLNVTGHWFPPSKPGAGQPGFGYSVQTEPEFEFYAAYLYDGQGIPRWLLANRSGFNAGANTLTIEQFSNGPCPACTGPGVQPTPRVQVGTLNRVFSGGSLNSVEVAAQFAAPLTGNWLESLPVARLSDPKVCP